MLLEKVEYHLFPGDVAWLEENSAFLFHDIDREICLIGAGNEKRFMSWVQDSTDFHIEWSESPFFRGGDAIIKDFSDHPFWEYMIGKEIDIVPVEPKPLALKISSDDMEIFVCAYQQLRPDADGGWGADVVHVSKTLPKWQGEYR